MTDEEIKRWLDKHASIQDNDRARGGIDIIDGSVTIAGNFYIWDNTVTEIPFPITAVIGDIGLHSQKLKSLKNLPTAHTGSFDCSGNLLTSLEGAPSIIKTGHFLADDCRLTSLKGSPRAVYGSFSVVGNQLQSLEGIPSMIALEFAFTINTPFPLLRIFSVKRLQVVSIYSATEPKKKLLNEIINKHLKAGPGGMMPCTAELIKSGLREYAKW